MFVQASSKKCGPSHSHKVQADPNTGEQTFRHIIVALDLTSPKLQVPTDPLPAATERPTDRPTRNKNRNRDRNRNRNRNGDRKKGWHRGSNRNRSRNGVALWGEHRIGIGVGIG